RAVAFYRDVLGFKVEAAWPDEKSPMWANLELGRQSIMLGAMMSPDKAAEFCGGDEGARRSMETLAKEFAASRNGVGVVVYVMVEDVDAYHAALVKKGVQDLPAPRSQFYGIRDFAVQDPDGYRLLMYSPITMSSCQSCGMPLEGATPGQMDCAHCTDEHGKLRPYESVLEGTTAGYFMQMQKLPRPQAEKAAREHLGKLPAWAGRS
ncbi:MAG TPA: VOC family protein, partial [Planctomycetota bacterium]|nr:VOC family protein [Planctomycetota bacterium]